MKKLILIACAVIVSVMFSAVVCSAGINDELRSAVEKNDIKKVKELIAKGADVNAKDNHGTTPLMFAALMERAEAAKVLIEKGADVNAKDPEGWTPLIFAIRLGQAEIAKLLIEKGADANAKDTYGWTPLMHAAGLGHTAIVKIRLDKGADINAKSLKGDTALTIAEREKKKDMVILLQKAGAK
jgi:ankyrin repeat protein